MAKTLTMVLAISAALAAAPVRAQAAREGIAATGTQASHAGLDIIVFADYYFVAGRSFDDLDLLESAVGATRAGLLTLSACGEGVTRPVMAAAHRFSGIPLSLRVAGVGDAGCVPVPSLALRVGESTVQRPHGIDDEAVARYWRNLMP
jgi:hypothetical protein